MRHEDNFLHHGGFVRLKECCPRESRIDFHQDTSQIIIIHLPKGTSGNCNKWLPITVSGRCIRQGLRGKERGGKAGNQQTVDTGPWSQRFNSPVRVSYRAYISYIIHMKIKILLKFQDSFPILHMFVIVHLLSFFSRSLPIYILLPDCSILFSNPQMR